MKALITPARYEGPFSRVEEFYWRGELATLLDDLDGDIAKAEQLKDLSLQRIDPDNPGSSAFFCVLTQQPISDADAAPNPDWIPPGAQLARIQCNLYDQLGPMLSI